MYCHRFIGKKHIIQQSGNNLWNQKSLVQYGILKHYQCWLRQNFMRILFSSFEFHIKASSQVNDHLPHFYLLIVMVMDTSTKIFLQSTTIVVVIIGVNMGFQIIYITRLNGVLAFNKILSYFMQYNGSIEYTTLDHNILSQSNTSICSFPLIFNVGILSLYSNQ